MLNRACAVLLLSVVVAASGAGTFLGQVPSQRIASSLAPLATKLTPSEKLQALRKLMADRHIDAYIVPSTDAHQSEYVAECDLRRAFLTEFTGSAGTAVVTKNKALLWTDGRYWSQAEHELSKDWTLMKSGQDGVPTIQAWLARNLLPPSVVGYDPIVFSINDVRRYEAELGKDRRVLPFEPNLVDLIWGSERPPLPSTPLMVLPDKYTGASSASKLELLRSKMKEAGAQLLVVSALDEVAWLFNLRGADIDYNPVFMSYAVVTPDNATLYVDPVKITSEVKAHLGPRVLIRNYSAVFADLRRLPPSVNRVWMDANQANVALYNTIPQERMLAETSPITLLKGIKNPVELEGARQAQIRDGVALVRFFSWLERAVDGPEAGSLDECSVSDKLEAFRKEGKDFMGLSFPTIAGSGPNGAIIHYQPKRGSCAKVTKDLMLLVDSGAQYKDGTTDTTRTVHFGTPTSFQKVAFTRVLQGHIALASAIFPPGTPGPNLDVLARLPLYKEGLNYNHGTGHGVGAFLNVHEGPHGINNGHTMLTPLHEGMLVSDEPGYYEDGEFGIRIESVIAVKKAETAHHFEGKPYLGFENLTMAPIQRRLIDLQLLSSEEIAWLNSYHVKVRQALSPFLSGPDLEYLIKETEPVHA